MLIAAGFLAAGIFALVSMAANLKFGISLGSSQVDKAIYGALSLGADLMKVALPLVALILWRKGYHLLSATGAAFWIGLVAFSLAAAVGFAASTRGETVAANMTVIDSRKSWEAKIERVEHELGQLGVPRPSVVIQSEIDALLRIPGADGCKVINGPVTRDVCPKVDMLRKERAVADRVADLEGGALYRLANSSRASLWPLQWPIRNPPHSPGSCRSRKLTSAISSPS